MMEAHARRTDPGTSHFAASAISPGLPHLQMIVEKFAFARQGGFTDPELVEAYPDIGPSTLRTRRSELVARNIILPTGAKRVPDGKTMAHNVWSHRHWMAGPVPPILDPPEAERQANEERISGLEHAVKLEGFARSLMLEGRVSLADALKAAATYIRSVAA